MSIRHFFVCAISVFSFSWPALAYQLFSTAKRINPSYKNFKYYLSSTYYNYTADGQRPITDAHIAGVKRALDTVVSKAATVGVVLTFDYMGTFDQETDEARNASDDANDAFDKTIYYDFTSNELWGRQYVASAAADSKKSSASGSYAAGGVIRFNSDFLNFLHPDGHIAPIVMHETLHILGLDHSTVASANMAYTEFWYETLSADDLLGLQNLYGIGADTTLNWATTLSGQAAPGVEVVAINTTTGVSYVGMTDSTGSVTMKHVPYGTYIFGSRELTPTGPCFENPTRGFLASFYVSAGVATNNVTSATAVTLAAGSQVSVALSLIAGTKKFDCHYGQSTALSDEACNSNIAAGEPTFQEKCYLQMTTKNVRYPMLGFNDKTVFNHQTDTDLNSGVHSSVTIQALGTQPGLQFHSAEFVSDIGSYSKIDLEVLSTATNGLQAALCTAGGEYGLMSSFIEVQDFGGSSNNEHMLSDFSDTLYEASLLPRNFGQNLRPGDANPSVGERPPNVKTSDTIPSKTKSKSSSSSKEKKWYECGTILNTSPQKRSVAAVLLLAPLAFMLGSSLLKKKRGKRV